MNSDQRTDELKSLTVQLSDSDRREIVAFARAIVADDLGQATPAQKRLLKRIRLQLARHNKARRPPHPKGGI